MQLDGTFGDSRGDFVKQEIRSLGGSGGGIQVLAPAVRPDTESSKLAVAVLVDELERVDREEGFLGEAGRNWLGRGDKRQSAGMPAQELLDRRWLGRIGTGRLDGAQEFQKFFRSPDREAVDGMADDVGVNVFGQMEAYRETPGTGVRVVVGYRRDAGRIREANRYRSGFPLCMRRAGERGRVG